MDLLCAPEREDATGALLAEALEFFHESDCNIVTALAPEGSRLAKALSGAGFLNSRENLNIFFGRHGLRVGDKSVRESIERCSKETIHFCYGDIDSLPVGLPGKKTM